MKTIDSYIVEIRSNTDRQYGDLSKDILAQLDNLLPEPHSWIYVRRTGK